MPKSLTTERRKRVSDLGAAPNNSREMKELAARRRRAANVGVDGMDAFMKEEIKLCNDAAQSSRLGGAK